MSSADDKAIAKKILAYLDVALSHDLREITATNLDDEVRKLGGWDESVTPWQREYTVRECRITDTYVPGSGVIDRTLQLPGLPRVHHAQPSTSGQR